MIGKHSFSAAVWILIFCSVVLYGNPQVRTGSIEVTLSSSLTPPEVPLNRSAVLKVTVSWQGDIDQIEIDTIEEPVLTNFEITGTSSANRVEDVGGMKRAVKEIGYTLTPTTLGMAYVESVGLSYKDLVSGKTHHLRTERVGIKGVSPVADPDASNMVWIWIAVPVLLVAAASFYMLTRNRKNRKSDIPEPEPIIEEKYLDLLKESINPETSESREAFTQLSRLFRKYLSEKFNITALETTTAELLQILLDEGLDGAIIEKCGELFNKADLVKFSGQNADPVELRDGYSTVESFLEEELARAREAGLAAEAEQTKGKKLKK